MAAPRRVGAESSKTRAALLECAEQLMLDDGYAAVTYRAVAAKAGVTGGLVQYYFPSADDLFIAMLRRRSDRNLDRLTTALDEADNPLRVVWEYNTDETTAALLMEFQALSNHRKSIRAEISAVTKRARQVQLDALAAYRKSYELFGRECSPAMVLFVVATIPKMLQLEDAMGVTAAHDEVRDVMERYVDTQEPAGPDGGSTPPDPS